jgi:hypothetical protein
MKKGEEIYDLECYIHFQTEKAILVSLDGKRDTAVWLPKSLIEWEPKNRRVGVITVTGHTDLLLDKGLI